MEGMQQKHTSMLFLIIISLVICTCLAIDCQKNLAMMQPNVYNVKHLKNDLDCFINKGACAKISAACKRRLPQDVSQACKKCSPRFKHHLKVFLARIKELFPEDYVTFRRKYDPSGKHFNTLEARLNKY